jgi:copper chaperone CopZ
MLHYGFVALPADLARALAVGLVLAALITALVPESVFVAMREHVGGFWLMLVMMAAGIPVYVCATASVPIAAALIAKGVSPGAAMVFLITGPATNAATLATVWRTMGRRTAIVYLATVAACALGAGLLLDGLFPGLGARIGGHLHAHHDASWWQWIEVASAAALLAMLGYALAGPMVRRLRRGGAEGAKEPVMTLKVTGMTCSHCARGVREALLEGRGVTAAEVDLAAGLATVDGDDLDAEALCTAIRELGYDAKPAE